MKKKLIMLYARALTEKIKYLLCFGLLFAINQPATAQIQKKPTQKEKNICGITSKYSAFINKRVSEKIAALRANGKLKNTADNIHQVNPLATPISFSFPLADIKHRDFASWRMFNYVDLDPDSYFVDLNHDGKDDTNTDPDEVGDYNCGDRCYDYHSGIDILLEPYYWKEKADESIWVIAAAPGVIVDKHDGAFDEQCDPPDNICGSEPDNRGNYVVILHDDGSTASFYMHMVQNSLTTKQEGDRVNTGDYLGIAGSSGCSSGPHLHFEVRTGYVDAGTGYEKTGTVVDPFANGSCATSTSSWWINEPPYNDPAILTMESHSSNPEDFVEGIDWCDKFVSLFPSNSFSAGQNVWLHTKFRDWLDGSTATFNIYKPDGSLWRSYTRTNTTQSRAYIPSDGVYGFTSADPAGTYRYTIAFGGKTYSHYFTKDCQTSLGLSGAISGQKGYMVSNFISSFQTIPGVSTNYVKYMADGHVTLSPGFRATSGCRFVANTEGCNNSTVNGIAAESVPEQKDNLVTKQNEIPVKENVKVYPNPSKGIFTMQYNNKGSFNAIIMIRDINGKIAYTSKNKSYNNQLTETINLGRTTPGIYLAEIHIGTQIISSKVLIQ